MRARTIGITAALASALGLLAGCPGRIEDPERFGAGIHAGDGGSGGGVEAMLARECAGSGCHGRAAPAVGLDLESPGVGERLLAATSASCSGRALVDPSDPDASFLLEKVSDASPECGGRMPLLREPLSAAEIAAIRAWIMEL